MNGRVYVEEQILITTVSLSDDHWFYWVICVQIESWIQLFNTTSTFQFFNYSIFRRFYYSTIIVEKLNTRIVEKSKSWIVEWLRNWKVEY